VKSQYLAYHTGCDNNTETYILSFYFLAAEFLNCIIQLVLSAEVSIGKDLLVQGPRVGDDTSNIYANIAGIGPGTRYVTASSNSSIIEEKVAINATRWQAGKADLVPPTDVDDSIRKMYSLNMIQDVLLLQTQTICQSFDIEAKHCCGTTYIISQRLDTPGHH
jgi:hypothetical protein